MKTKIFAILTAILLFGAAASPAYADLDIYEDTDIYGGSYWFINIYDTPPDHTTVNIYDVNSDYITTYDESTLNFFGGSAQIGANNNSIVNITGGNLNGADAYNYGTVNFYDGAISTSLGAYDHGISNVYGGTIDHIGVVGSGEVNIYSGLIIDSLSAYESSILNLHAYNFYYDPTGGDYDGGKITGNWILDDVYFDISLYGSETFLHINVVPEPTMFILFGIGSLMLLCKNNSKNNTKYS